MQSRRDQVQAYFFVVGRLAAAVTHGRPDVPEAPNRRSSTGVALGLVLAGLVTAAFGLYGAVVPGGNTAWKTPGVIVIDSDTGARYLNIAGQLRPVLNFPSARLASGNNNAPVSVSSASLVGASVGQPIGIRGAPDNVPAGNRLDRGPWTVCSGGAGDGTALLLGRPPGAAIPSTQALLVATPDGARSLIWQGTRHRLNDANALAVLGYARPTPTVVSPSWMNAVPLGRDLSLPATQNVGDAGPSVDGRSLRVGQVLEQRSATLGGDKFYLLRSDGLAPLTRAGVAVLLASPTTAAAYQGEAPTPVQVSAAGIARVPSSRGPSLVDGFPQTPPQAVAPPAGFEPCVRYTPAGSGPPTVLAEIRSRIEVQAGTLAPARRVPGVTADLVSVPAGGGATVRSSPVAAVELVAEDGQRHVLADPKAAGLLGYGPDTIVTIPRQLLDLLPVGTELSSAAALREGPS